jgi:hypothetical protein
VWRRRHDFRRADRFALAQALPGGAGRGGHPRGPGDPRAPRPAGDRGPGGERHLNAAAGGRANGDTDEIIHLNRSLDRNWAEGAKAYNTAARHRARLADEYPMLYGGGW